MSNIIIQFYCHNYLNQLCHYIFKCNRTVLFHIMYCSKWSFAILTRTCTILNALQHLDYHYMTKTPFTCIQHLQCKFSSIPHIFHLQNIQIQYFIYDHRFYVLHKIEGLAQLDQWQQLTFPKLTLILSCFPICSIEIMLLESCKLQ